MPRTVCTSSGLAGSCSIFRRRRLTCMSTARSPVAPSLPANVCRGHRLAGSRGEQAQHVALAIREPHDLLAALELTAREMEAEVAEAHRFHHRSRSRRGAAQNAGDAQRKLPRLERLAHVVVGADGETF